MAERDNAQLDDLDKTILNTIKHEREVSLEDLVLRLSQKLDLRDYDLAKRIYRLEKLKLIAIEDPAPPRDYISYMLSHRSLWFWLTVAVVWISLASIYVLPQNTPLIIIRYVFGALFVLYIPGFTLIKALYPREEDLTPLERLALSIGLSLAMVPLVGLVLNYTPWGIRLTPIAASLALLSMTLALIASIRCYSFFKLSVKIREKAT